MSKEKENQEKENQESKPATEKKGYRPEPEIEMGVGDRQLKVGDEPEIPVRRDPPVPPSVPNRETTPPQA